MNNFSLEKLKDYHQQKKEYSQNIFFKIFYSFFECFNDRSEVDGREDRRES